MTLGLFDDLPAAPQAPDWLEPGAVVLRGLALPQAAELLQAVDAVTAQAPFRHLITPVGSACRWP